MGSDKAPLTVTEFFSLTCVHCARFHHDVYPQVKAELIDTGKIKLVWRDFPLDGLALVGASIARSLPADRYEPFVSALLSSQDRWAFKQSADPLVGIATIAALAGVGRAQFDAIVADQDLRKGIVTGQTADQKEHRISSTPSFVFGALPTEAGEMTFGAFARLVEKAS